MAAVDRTSPACCPIATPANGHPQQAAFFCLETEHWRILGVDTGYNSVGLPFLGSIPGVKKLPWVGADASLPQPVLDWIRDAVRPGDRPRATLLLSHHQPFSGFGDEAFPRASRQLRPLLGEQAVVWMWGHEHRLALYNEAQSPSDGLRCHGRCVGVGGMPVETAPPRLGLEPLAYWDPRQHRIGGEPVGFNGFVNLTLDGNRLGLDYRDRDDRSLLRETFTAAASGAIAHHWDDVPVLQPPARHG